MKPIPSRGRPARGRSRYAAVSRRSFLSGSAGVAGVFLIGCGTGDDDAFAGATAETVPTTSPSDQTTSGVATSETSVNQTTSPGPSVQAPKEGVLEGELVVAFSFTPEGGGRILNPYVAVWIEDASGTLVDTLAVWYQQSEKGPRWLRDLKEWYSADQGRIAAGGSDTIDALSSATRVAGAYEVVWDGTDSLDQPVSIGDYFVCIEAAREHGPYELIRELVTFDGSALVRALPDNGELTDASIDYQI